MTIYNCFPRGFAFFCVAVYVCIKEGEMWADWLQTRERERRREV